MKLSGKTAIITGATSGIGKATALLFAEEGADVVITGRRAELGQRVSDEIRQKGVRCVFVQADHTQAEACSRVVERTLAEFGHIDILFNNAGIVTKGTAETTEEAIWNETLAINVTAVWRMNKLVIPHMKKQGGGVIVNNGSDWSVVAGKDAFPYVVSKGAVGLMTKAMALSRTQPGRDTTDCTSGVRSGVCCAAPASPAVNQGGGCQRTPRLESTRPLRLLLSKRAA